MFLFLVSVGVPCVCVDWRRTNNEVFPVPWKHSVRPNDSEVQLVVLHRLQEQSQLIRLQFASFKKLSTDEGTFVLLQLQEEQQQRNGSRRRGEWLWCGGPEKLRVIQQNCLNFIRKLLLFIIVYKKKICTISERRFSLNRKIIVLILFGFLFGRILLNF